MPAADRIKPHKGIYYIVLSFALWVFVEYLTVWHSRFAEWISLMPYVLIQYLVIVLVFFYLIFRKTWNGRSTFILMLVVMYVFEFLWANPLLLDPVTFIPASLLLTSIWGFLTFLPLWCVRRELSSHKLPMVLCFLWIPTGFVAAIVLG
jgi:hypothetical protein